MRGRGLNEGSFTKATELGSVPYGGCSTTVACRGSVLHTRLVAIKLQLIGLQCKSRVIRHVADEGLNNLKRVVFDLRDQWK